MKQSTPVVRDFMRFRHAAAVLSLVLFGVSVAALAVKGLNLGLDFTGGTEVRLSFSEPADLDRIREEMAALGQGSGLVKRFGSEREVLLKLPQGHDDTVADALIARLQANTSATVTVNSVDFVGPQVGEELREQGGLAVLTALALVMLYVAFRFQFKFAVGAVAALVHDVVISVGVYAVFGWSFDLTVLAALLAVIGYSLNDTIVVADRIRENFRRLRRGTSTEIINASLTQTLARTLVTSLTTALVLLAMFAVGGDGVHEFARTLLIGVAVGTYSSIYVAANILLFLRVTKQDLMRPETDRKQLEEGVV